MRARASSGFVFCLSLGLGACRSTPATFDGAVTVDLAMPAKDGGPSLSTVVVMETTMGDLAVRLATSEMPITTANFLAYVDSGFFNGTLIHRVVDDWVIQGGGYTTGLRAKAPGEPIVLETSPNVKHVHGAISMARTNDPDSATSQWFICDWPKNGPPKQPASLDGKYAAFGILIEGFEVLEKITQVMTVSKPPHMDVPAQEIVVKRAYRR